MIGTDINNQSSLRCGRHAGGWHHACASQKMKERIRELAGGQVEFKKPEFTIVPDELNEKINIDGIYRTQLVLDVKNGAMLKGVAYSTHSRVTIPNRVFYGKNVRIEIEVNTMGLSGQARIEGALNLVTNVGTRTVPYFFDMQEKGYGPEGRTFPVIEDFADYVIDDEKNALKLFRSGSFIRLPFMKELNRQALYQTLCVDRNERRGMEEFLVYNKAKASISYEVNSEPIVFSEISEDMRGTVTVKKSTWGYGILNISTDKPWLSTDMSSVTTDAFNEEGILEIPFTINPEVLGTGMNEGHVMITSVRGEQRVEVRVQKTDRVHFSSSKNLSEKELYAEGLRLYIEYRVAKVKGESGTEQLVKLLRLCERMCSEDPGSWEKKLFLIYFRLINGDIPGAEQYIDDVREEVMKNRLKNNRAYCFFLHIRAIYNESSEQMDTAAKLIMKYYTENGQDPMLMLMLLQTDESVRENRSLCILRLKELFQNGCHSPLLYVMACEIYRESPDLFRVLNEFEMQCVRFGAKWGILSQQVAENAARAGSYESRFDQFTLHMLEDIHTQYPTHAVLENICSYLIRCNMRGEQYFNWYSDGIKDGVNIVGLYEAYLESLPADFEGALPEEVLLYFAYSQDLRDDLKELIYDNILKYYPESTQVYAEYSDQMEEYAITSLLAGHISRRMVPLYKKLVYQDMIDERLAGVLPELLLACEIKCDNPVMERMIVRCPELGFEDSYDLDRGVTYAPVYTADSFIMFVDSLGNRYTDVPYKSELIFSQPELLTKCEEVYPENLVFMVRRAMTFIDRPLRDDKERELLDKLLLCAEISEVFRGRIISRLLDYCMNKDKPMVEEVLMSLDLPSLSYHDRRKALECMIKAGHLEEVYEYIRDNSVNGLKYDSLLKIALNHYNRIGGASEDYLISLSMYLFGKSITTSELCEYLCRFYNGSNEEMKRLLFTCEKHGGDVSDLPERVLAQMLFSGDKEDIEKVYKIYRSCHGLKETVIRAYHVLCCYEYFVNRKTIDIAIFGDIADILYGTETMSMIREEYQNIDIISIALLYYLTENENVILQQNEMCEDLLKKLVRKGLLFGFYAKLSDRVSVPAILNGKLLLEHRSTKASRVFLTMRRMNTEDEVTVVMQKMYDGVFVSQLVVFADETYEYGISEEIRGHVVSVISRRLISDELTFSRGGSMFDTINDFVRLEATGQYNLLEDAVMNHEKRQHIISELFKPL